MYRVSPFVRRFAWALLGGAGLATLWVNLSPASYYDAMEYRLLDALKPAWLAGETLVITPMTVTSELLMPLFLFFVGKELWEALVLQRGALSGRRALLPTGAVIGSCLGAMLLWVLHSAFFVADEWVPWSAGWPLPIGSEIIIGYVVGRMVFGPGHPALHLLLLISIATSILGILITGLAYPGGGLQWLWLLLPLTAALGVARLSGRTAAESLSERDRRRGQVLWPYVLAGLLSWFGVVAAGLPGALGLLPIIPAIPHAERSFGLFAEAEEYLHDPLNRLAHLLVKPLALVLFLFGLTRGGIDLAAFAPTTITVLLAVWIGKPLGLFLGALLTAQLFRLPMPAGVRIRDLLLVAVISGIGFTVPVLALDSALPGGAMTEAARLGFALSLLAWPAALVMANLLRRLG
jgi:NhaA family Na+:H+ antiporter